MTLIKRFLPTKAWVTPLPQGVNITLVRTALFTKRKTLAMPKGKHSSVYKRNISTRMEMLKLKYENIKSTVLYHQLVEE